MDPYQPVLTEFSRPGSTKNEVTLQLCRYLPRCQQHTGQSCAGIVKGPRAAVSESLTLSAVTCSVSLNIWFVQLSEDHFSAADWSARDSTQQQCLLGPAIILLSGFQTGEVKSEAPIADGFRDYKRGLQLLRPKLSQKLLPKFKWKVLFRQLTNILLDSHFKNNFSVNQT